MVKNVLAGQPFSKLKQDDRALRGMFGAFPVQITHPTSAYEKQKGPNFPADLKVVQAEGCKFNILSARGNIIASLDFGAGRN